MASLMVPPRTWRAYFRQALVALIFAAVLVGLLALVANDVPWALLILVVAVVLIASALGTAVRMRRQ